MQMCSLDPHRGITCLRFSYLECCRHREAEKGRVFWSVVTVQSPWAYQVPTPSRNWGTTCWAPWSTGPISSDQYFSVVLSSLWSKLSEAVRISHAHSGILSLKAPFRTSWSDGHVWFLLLIPWAGSRTLSQMWGTSCRLWQSALLGDS